MAVRTKLLQESEQDKNNFPLKMRHIMKFTIIYFTKITNIATRYQ